MQSMATANSHDLRHLGSSSPLAASGTLLSASSPQVAGATLTACFIASIFRPAVSAETKIGC